MGAFVWLAMTTGARETVDVLREHLDRCRGHVAAMDIEFPLMHMSSRVRQMAGLR